MFADGRALLGLALCCALPLPSFADGASLTSDRVQPDGNGNAIWTPISGNLNRFSVLLPAMGISEALRYNDTSSLYYLSEISEHELTARPSAVPSFNFTLAPGYTEASALWTLNTSLELGVGVTAVDSKTTPELHVRAMFPKGSMQYSALDLNISKESQISWQATTLLLDENTESLRFAELVDDADPSFSLSYGERYWEIWPDVDFAWSTGILENDPYANIQFEKSWDEVRGLFRLTAQEGKSVEFRLGIEISTSLGKFGTFNTKGLSRNSGSTVLENRSLRTLRRAYLSSQWNRDVNLFTIKRTQALP